MTQPYQPAPTPPPSEPKSKRKQWPWIAGIAAVVIVIGAIASQDGVDKKDDDKTASGSATSAVEAPADAPAAPAAPAAPKADEVAAATLPPLKAASPSGKGKQVQYEVVSDSGTLNSVTWFDENSEMQQKSSASAPWTLTVNNTSTVVMAGVTAQTDGTSVTCRVVVDGKVEDEQTATGKYAVVNCTAAVF